ncbi:hypothetical protein PAXRUDRAFT_8252 [Paxillus rubicundulus Ve08.2h10]|uniref:Uncharacterized protein n=1 Tax=Paxillus rubicundulus Ve08.2h10 TaxID=930991 RepID=A0A0D0ED24_9AGAM|nr:hypothetical protein PAXRUDRAFT_8252 [Paxillus rubicundulus Ve08.2h10]
MATAQHHSHRAALLNGLRTGGVRSNSMSTPHTAAPGGSFNIPRFASTAIQQSIFPEGDDVDQLGELFSQNLYVHNNNPANNNGFSATASSARPLTAAVDNTSNRFIQQQMAGQRGLNPNSAPFSPAYPHGVQPQVTPAEAQLHAYQQMQLMQLEIMRLQNAQVQRNQQVQAVVLAEALRQQARRGGTGMNPPASAGPTNFSFDTRANSPPARRPSQAETLKAQLGVSGVSSYEDQGPMTAALGGRFGARLPASSIAFPTTPDVMPRTSSPPKQTTVIDAVTPLGSSPPHNLNSNLPKDNVPSKSDVATSWRRGNTTNSVLSGLRTVSTASPSVKITPPPGERTSPPLILTPANKLRPRPLSFTFVTSRNSPIVAIDSGSEHEDAMSSASSASLSNPATPHSSSSLDTAPLSPREEATKKLYEGLGMGRPAPYIVQTPMSALPQRLVSQPVRHPRGPPSGADELGPKNFATRIRRKAIGGLGVLMDARERRESIEVC